MAGQFACDPTLAANSSYKLSGIRTAIEPPQQWLDESIGNVGIPGVESALGDFSYSASTAASYLSEQVGNASDLLGALADGTDELDGQLAASISSLGLLPGVPPPAPPATTVTDASEPPPENEPPVDTTADAKPPAPPGDELPVDTSADTKPPAPPGDEPPAPTTPEAGEPQGAPEGLPPTAEGPASAFDGTADPALADQPPEPTDFETPEGIIPTTPRTGSPDDPEWAKANPQGMPEERTEEGPRVRALRGAEEKEAEEITTDKEVGEAVNDLWDAHDIVDRPPKTMEICTPDGTITTTALTGDDQWASQLAAHPAPGDFVAPLHAAAVAGVQGRNMFRGILRWLKGESYYWGPEGPPDVDAIAAAARAEEARQALASPKKLPTYQIGDSTYVVVLPSQDA